MSFVGKENRLGCGLRAEKSCRADMAVTCGVQVDPAGLFLEHEDMMASKLIAFLMVRSLAG